MTAILTVTITKIHRHLLFTFVTSRRENNMQKIEFNADVDSFKNDNKDITTITLKALGKDVSLNQLREMKETASIHVIIESNQTELIEDDQ